MAVLEAVGLLAVAMTAAQLLAAAVALLMMAGMVLTGLAVVRVRASQKAVARDAVKAIIKITESAEGAVRSGSVRDIKR